MHVIGSVCVYVCVRVELTTFSLNFLASETREHSRFRCVALYIHLHMYTQRDRDREEENRPIYLYGMLTHTHTRAHILQTKIMIVGLELLVYEALCR
jgi:hypothetical protein